MEIWPYIPSDSLARLEGHLIGVRFGDCIKPHPAHGRRMYGVRMYVCMYVHTTVSRTSSLLSSAGLLVLTGIVGGMRSKGCGAHGCLAQVL